MLDDFQHGRHENRKKVIYSVISAYVYFYEININSQEPEIHFRYLKLKLTFSNAIFKMAAILKRNFREFSLKFKLRS